MKSKQWVKRLLRNKIKTVKTIENPTIIWWKIYYRDFSTWTSDKDGSWEEAPSTNVQVILLWRKDKNTRILFGRDFYWYASNTLFGQTNNSTEVKGQLKTGSWAEDWTFQKILWEALLDKRELYHPGKYDRKIPPMPNYLLIDRDN